METLTGKQEEEVIKPAIIKVHGGETISACYLELFGRVHNRIRPGWVVVGNQFLSSDDPPWQVRWDGLKGTAVEKLATFDPKLAAELKGRKITLTAAKRILLQRDCDAFAKLRISQLLLATAPLPDPAPATRRRPHPVSPTGTEMHVRCPLGAAEFLWVAGKEAGADSESAPDAANGFTRLTDGH